MQELKTRGAGESQKQDASRESLQARIPWKEVVIFSCKGDDAMLSLVTGLTETLETTGIAFLTEAAVEVGLYISLNLHLRSATSEGKTILL